MSLDGSFDTIEAYFTLLDKLGEDGLVPGMDIPCWAALIPRDRLRLVPTFTKDQLPTAIPKDHPSAVQSFFAPDDPVMQAFSDVPKSIGPDSSYRIVPSSGTIEEVLESLKLPLCFQVPDPTINLPSRIPAIIELRAPHLNDILPSKPILDPLGLPSVAYGSRDRICNVTPTGYQAAPHIDLMEVVLVSGTTTKLWVLYKTPAGSVENAIRPTRGVDGYTVESMRNLITTWSQGYFYILLQKPGDLAIVPSGWWHFVETLSGGVLGGVETFIAQGFNLQHNITHLQADFVAAILGSTSPKDQISLAQEELQIAITFFSKMLDFTCELLQQDTAPWRYLSSVTNALKPLQRMIADVSGRLKASIFSFTYLKMVCQKLRTSVEKLARVMRTVIETAEEVLNQNEGCATLRGCKWHKRSDKQQTWVEHCLGSTKHFPFALLVEALNDVIVSKEEEKKERERRAAEAREEQAKQREASRASALPVRKSRRVVKVDEEP
ncbi:hypothetical protein TWF281_004636 [Arthrobotrys megalospora]